MRDLLKWLSLTPVTPISMPRDHSKELMRSNSRLKSLRVKSNRREELGIEK